MKLIGSIKYRFRQFANILPQQYKGGLLLLLGLLVLNSVLEFLGLSFFLPIINMLISGGKDMPAFGNFDFNDSSVLLMFCVFILAFFVIRILIFSLIWKYQLNLTYKIFLGISEDIINRVYDRGFLYINQKNPHSIINDFYTVPLQYVLKVIVPSLILLNELMVILFIAGALLYFYWSLILFIALLVLPIMMLLFNYYKKRLAVQTKEMNRLTPLLWDSFFDLIHGYIDVKVTGNERVFKKVTMDRMTAFSDRSKFRSYFDFLPNKVLEFLLIIGMVSIIFWGKSTGLDNAKLLTVLGVFTVAFYRIFPSINRIIVSAMDVKSNMFCSDMIYDYKQGEIAATEVVSAPVTFSKQLTFADVRFSYESKQVLQGLDLIIKKNTIAGFIGPSGSGKSTLAFLITGFLKPSSGSILVDDTELDAKHTAAWLKKVGYVKQDVFISENTVEHNIVFGSEVDAAKLKRALQLSKAHEFVNELPEKEQTVLGEKGVKLSGGQRQRIGIARAIYHGAELIVFDEATSALDPETEAVINDSVLTLKEAGLTLVIIAHRYSSLKNTDQIFELKDGVIVRELHYDQLLTK